MENVSKRVVALDNGRICGYVLNVFLNENFDKVGYYVADENEDILLLPTDKIVANSHALIIKNESDLQYIEETKQGLVGKEVYDISGAFYGNIFGLQFNKNHLVKIITDKCEICKKHLKNLNGDVILCDFSRKRNIKKHDIFKTNQNLLVTLLEEKNDVTRKPETIFLSSKFYLGKCACEDVFGYNNERLVRRGEKITNKIFENVKKHNKLNELFFVLKNR